MQALLKQRLEKSQAELKNANRFYQSYVNRIKANFTCMVCREPNPYSVTWPICGTNHEPICINCLKQYILSGGGGGGNDNGDPNETIRIIRKRSEFFSCLCRTQQ